MPYFKVNGGATTNYNNLSLFIGINYGNKSISNTRYPIEATRNVTVPYYVQGNLNLSYRVNEKFNVALIANNLGRKYSDPDESVNIDTFGENGLIQPGETVLLKLKYVFGE